MHILRKIIYENRVSPILYHALIDVLLLRWHFRVYKCEIIICFQKKVLEKRSWNCMFSDGFSINWWWTREQSVVAMLCCRHGEMFFQHGFFASSSSHHDAIFACTCCVNGTFCPAFMQQQEQTAIARDFVCRMSLSLVPMKNLFEQNKRK